MSNSKQHIEAWNRIEIKEESKIMYFLKYTLPDKIKRLFHRDVAEEILSSAFDIFYKQCAGNFDPVSESEYATESEFEEANDLYYEVTELLEYWATRDHFIRNRIKDDQMLIRLVKIRHKLNF